MIHLIRAYETIPDVPAKRVLVDRLWPRGLKKDDLEVDFWAKEIAPSDALRKWYSHDPVKWSEFKRRYFEELDRNQKVEDLVEMCRNGDVIFLYSSKERASNNAVALKEYIESHT